MTTAFQSNAFQTNAFQIDVTTTSTAGVNVGGGWVRQTSRSPLVPHDFTRKKYNELLKDIERDKKRKAKELTAAQAAAKREAALTALQRAERDLAVAQTAFEQLAHSLATFPTAEKYTAFMQADARITQLRSLVDELRASELVQKAKTEKERADAEANAVIQGRAAEERQRVQRQAVIDAMAEAAGIHSFTQEIQRQRLHQIAVRAEAERQAAQLHAVRAIAEHAKQEQARISAQKAQEEEDQMNELIKLGMQWTNQS